MSWPASTLVAFLTAAVACVLAGAIALLCVDWYRISSFEGKSGYYVVGIALVGFVAGLVIGFVASRIIAGTLHPTFLKSLGASLLVVVAIAGVVGGTARLMADVPPRIGGEELLLAVEIRWPASQKESPAKDGVARRLRLHALAGRVARVDKEGPLWMEDAHLVDGRWVVPGAVEVFTSRGGRMLAIEPGLADPKAFLVPLPAYPRRAQLEWSEWMPRARPGAPPLPDGVTMRFKVLPRNQAVRTQTFGPFEIATVADGFYDDVFSDGRHALAASATFRVRHRGSPVSIDGTADGENGAPVKYDRFNAVALLPGAPDALLASATSDEGNGPVYLLVAAGDRVRSERVAPSLPRLDAPLVTNDSAKFAQARDRSAVPGRVDETTYAQPGDHLFDGALLSTQPPTVRRFSTTADLRLDPNVRPLGISPDRRQVVRVAFAEDYKSRALAVTNAESGETVDVPVDEARMRVSEVGALDPTWLQHYYVWAPTSGGHFTLEVRPNVVPLPYRGVLSTSSDGYREYRVGPAGKAMLDAIAAFLASDMGATRSAEDVAAFGYQAHVKGEIVHLIESESEHHIGVYMDRGGETKVVATIAERFHAALATGKYDALFTPEAKQ